MRRINITVVIYILFFIFLNVSYSDSKVSDAPVNIVVIIDTSDRVCKERHPDQRERDINVIKEVVDQFYKLVEPTIMKGGTIKTPHSLTLAVPKQPKTKHPSDEIISKLTITAPKKRSENPEFQKRKQELIDAIPELYDHVQQHPQTGSDIWDWFRSKAESSFSKNHQNLIICLSDGYLNFDIDIEAIRPEDTYMRVGTLRDESEAVNKIKNRSEGLRPVKNFSDLNIKFLMLEIRLREENGVMHFQDSDIIQAYWKTWLNAMGIKNTKFFEQLDPRGLKNVIENFIKLK
ncbi:MAG: hypothetical protein OXD54_01235 [Candidatus Poribacteria bacterium]|nr:hypothetical protein [Candidatus Poribacteria bacterium]